MKVILIAFLLIGLNAKADVTALDIQCTLEGKKILSLISEKTIGDSTSVSVDGTITYIPDNTNYSFNFILDFNKLNDGSIVPAISAKSKTSDKEILLALSENGSKAILSKDNKNTLLDCRELR